MVMFLINCEYWWNVYGCYNEWLLNKERLLGYINIVLILLKGKEFYK